MSYRNDNGNLLEMNKKKNQHYVPQFYLKNFSNNGEGKTINLFYLNKEKFIREAPIKNQSSKKFFYGEDGKVEEYLSQIENTMAPKVAAVTESNNLPKKYSYGHIALLTFIILNDLRNPTHLEQIKNYSKLTNREIQKFYPKYSEFLLDISQTDAVELLFSHYEKILETCLGLEFKLLINTTNVAFITSDFPCIKYNQFLEKKKIYGSITGYAVTGLQILLPLNSKKSILFFDPAVYKVGNRKDKLIELTNEDVDQINVLQILNCFQNIYFNEEINESYVRNIYDRSKKYAKANQLNATSHSNFGNNQRNGEEQIIHFSSADLRINLNLSGIKLIRGINYINLRDKFAPLRKMI